MTYQAASGGSAAREMIVGVSAWAQQIRAATARVARYDASVLITGPTGTGKELIARALHAESPRAAGPLVPVDCAALSGELFASHVFGHLRGAFTGAHYVALGAFRAADRGTIFLDEIGELGAEVQAKLLRVIQEKTVVPLGSHQGAPVDVRVIAATNRELGEDVRAGRFRQDLYYRLNVVSLGTVPLEERPEDIEVLAEHFLCRLAIEGGLPRRRLSPEASRLLVSYAWPGNVRELYNELERAVIFSQREVLEPESMPRLLEASATGRSAAAGAAAGAECAPDPPEAPLPPACRPERAAQRTTTDRQRWQSLEEVERSHILSTLEHTGYNQTAAANLLKLDRHALRRRIKKLGLDVPQGSRVGPDDRAGADLKRAAA